jgi:hypothetical protein
MRLAATLVQFGTRPRQGHRGQIQRLRHSHPVIFYSDLFLSDLRLLKELSHEIGQDNE